MKTTGSKVICALTNTKTNEILMFAPTLSSIEFFEIELTREQMTKSMTSLISDKIFKLSGIIIPKNLFKHKISYIDENGVATQVYHYDADFESGFSDIQNASVKVFNSRDMKNKKYNTLPYVNWIIDLVMYNGNVLNKAKERFKTLHNINIVNIERSEDSVIFYLEDMRKNPPKNNNNNMENTVKEPTIVGIVLDMNTRRVMVNVNPANDVYFLIAENSNGVGADVDMLTEAAKLEYNRTINEVAWRKKINYIDNQGSQYSIYYAFTNINKKVLDTPSNIISLSFDEILTEKNTKPSFNPVFELNWMLDLLLNDIKNERDGNTENVHFERLRSWFNLVHGNYVLTDMREIGGSTVEYDVTQKVNAAIIEKDNDQIIDENFIDEETMDRKATFEEHMQQQSLHYMTQQNAEYIIMGESAETFGDENDLDPNIETTHVKLLIDFVFEKYSIIPLASKSNFYVNKQSLPNNEDNFVFVNKNNPVKSNLWLAGFDAMTKAVKFAEFKIREYKKLMESVKKK